jgi:hypothetical protein
MSFYVQSNDRILNCASCDVHMSSNSSNFVVDIAQVDISNLNEWVRKVEDTVNTYMNDLTNYLNVLERSFELKYQSGLTKKDITLFNKINLVADRSKNFKSLQRAWRNNFLHETEYLHGLFLNYTRAKQIIDNAKSDTSNLDSLARAKYTTNKLKSVQRQTNKIDRLVSDIGLSIQRIQSMMNGLKGNVLSVDSKIFNIDEYIDLIKDLGNDVSPLTKIQNDLAEWINSNKYTVSTVQTVTVPEAPTFDSTKYKTFEEIENALRYAKMYVIYNHKTYTELESMFNYARSLADANQTVTLERLIQDIKQNTPENLITYFENLFRNPVNLIAELSRLKVIAVSNLDTDLKQKFTNIYYNLKDLYNQTQGIITEEQARSAATPQHIQEEILISNLRIEDVTFLRDDDFVIIHSPKTVRIPLLEGIVHIDHPPGYPFLGIFENAEYYSNFTGTPDFIRNSQQYRDLQQVIYSVYN